MNIEEALAFLAEHQPLPENPEIALVRQLHWALMAVDVHLDPRAIPLILGALNDFDDLTIFENVQSTLAKFKESVIRPYLLHALKSDNYILSLWAADTIRYFPNNSYLSHLEHLYNKHLEGSAEIRMVVAAVMEVINTAEAATYAIKLITDEDDPEIREILEAVIAGRR